MAEERYELHIWFNSWFPDDPKEIKDSGEWVYHKVVKCYRNESARADKIRYIIRNEWWLNGRLVPFRDVLRMEVKEGPPPKQ